MINPNIILPFDGENASIPTGFSRDTRFDGLFVKGASSGLGDTAGASTHSHTGTAHSHTMVSHTHTMTLSGPTDPTGEDCAYGGNGTDNGHSHNGRTPKTSTAMSGGTLTDTIAYPSSNHLPPYYDFIFVKSNRYNIIPQDCIILNSAASRNACDFHSSSASLYMRGAATGQDAGGTGGNLTHTHSLDHTHTSVNHSHTGDSGYDTSGLSVNTGSANKHATSGHSHTLYWQNTALAGSAATSLTSPAGDNSPLGININLFKATADVVPQKGDIAMLIDGSVPTGWLECDGSGGTPNMSGYYVKNKASAASGTSTSGSNTHTHAASNSHSHGSSSHTHTGSTSTYGGDAETGVSSYNASKTHAHGVTSVSTSSASWNSANVGAAEAVSNEPPYIKVKFIQMQFSVSCAAFAFLL